MCIKATKNRRTKNAINNDRRGGRRHQKNQGAVMNQEEELYFKVLSKQGREAWTIFKNPMYRGALEIAQNLYKDKAHFVYELLHNADNQGATHFSMRTKSRNKLNLM